MPRVIRPIRGFPGYLVGDDGSVWTRWKTRKRSQGGRGVESYISNSMKEMKPRDHNGGYLAMAFRKDGRYHYFLVHRLVLETFIGPCPEGMEALHGDGNRHNNRRSNLRWGTRKENEADKVRHGTARRGTEAAALVNRGKKRTFTVAHREALRQSALRRWRTV